MKLFKALTFVLLTICACQKPEDFLNRSPNNMLPLDDIWTDEQLVISVLADFYNRVPEYQHLEDYATFADFDEGYASDWGQQHRHKNADYAYGLWGFWPYDLIRDLNLFIKSATETDAFSENDQQQATKQRFIAEARIIRALVYFELVKRMGGVPIITEPLQYDFSGDPTYLQFPRAKEYEVYDFVIEESGECAELLQNNINVKSRATKGLALALRSRAALYAGAIAKYGVTTPAVSLPGEEVGISNDKAEQYYSLALEAAQRIMDECDYGLYIKNPEDLASNFAAIFLDKSNNPEVIFVKDYKLQTPAVHVFTKDNLPLSQAEQGDGGGRLNVSLNLVQAFERLDNTLAVLPIQEPDGTPLFYEHPSDLFKGRDARLAGTVLYPGSSFKGSELDIWAGYVLENGQVITASVPGGRSVLPGKTTEEKVVGEDGPIDGLQRTAQTGFYIRKHLDPTTGAGQDGTRSEVWWVRYRYGEVILNAAEAAFELGNNELSAQYLNLLRARAGFMTPLSANEVNFDRMVHERKVELAFEGHQLWDMKRWRLAHKIWNGTVHDLTSDPMNADEPSTRPFALWPYRVYNPGSPNDGKWIFRKTVPREVTNPDRFRLGNYYSFIGDDLVTGNPKIVRNPNH